LLEQIFYHWASKSTVHNNDKNDDDDNDDKDDNDDDDKYDDKDDRGCDNNGGDVHDINLDDYRNKLMMPDMTSSLLMMMTSHYLMDWTV